MSILIQHMMENLTMKTYTTEELETILINHKHWINDEESGERADLRGANLCGADLYGADLRGADLQEANLWRANLYEANLCEANLREANLQGADLCKANLRGADLHGANLLGAVLCEANLQEAGLHGANLREANLREANLQGADCFVPMTCPSEGDFIGWKKCDFGAIVKLLIPEDALRSSATGRKCRASKAVVLDIFDEDGNSIPSTTSMYDLDFIYKVGDVVQPTTDFDTDRWNECAPGIHFFISKEEAERYCK